MMNRSLHKRRRPLPRGIQCLEDRRLLAAQLIGVPKLTSVPAEMSLIRDEGGTDDSYWTPNRIVLTDEKWESGTAIVRGPGFPVSDFHSNMEIHLSGGSGGYGMAIGYAPLTGGEFGAAGQTSRGGLWMLIDTYSTDGWTGIKFYYDGQVVHSNKQPQSELRGKWKTVHLEVSGSGRVTYSYQGAVGSTSFNLANWHPQAHWRFGVGAQTKGKWDVQSIEDWWLIERTAAPTLTVPGSASTVPDVYDNTTPQFSWSASDVNGDLKSVTATVRHDSTETARSTKWSGSIDPSSHPTLWNAGTGRYDFTVQAVDKSGKTATTTRAYNLLDDDGEAPDVLINSLAGWQTQSHRENQIFTWNAVDPSGIHATDVTITRDGEVIYAANTQNHDTVIPTVGVADFQAGTFDFNAGGPGVYTISVIATDDDNDRLNDRTTGTAVTRSVTVTNGTPVAAAGLGQTVNEGAPLLLDGTHSTDPDGESLSYLWDFGDDTTASGAVVEHTYRNDGIYTASLTVTDSFGATDSSTVDIVVLNVAPKISSIVASEATAAGESVTVTVAATDAEGDTLSYEFDFDGDGVYETTNATGVATHTFADENVYPVNVRVSDGSLSDTDWIPILVGSPVTDSPDVPTPTVSFLNPQTTVGEEGGTSITIDAQLSHPISGNVVVPLQLTGTAAAGFDFHLPFNYLVFAAGQTNASVVIDILDDASDEEAETLSLAMADPVNAELAANTTHTITISDDDAPPLVSFTATERQLAEGSGLAAIRVRLSEVSGKPITVPVSIRGTATSNDYSLPDGAEIVIPPGAQSAVMTLGIVDDTESERNETIILEMQDPTNATIASLPEGSGSLFVTIPENDAPSVSLTTAYMSVREDVGTVTLTARLSEKHIEPVTIPVTFLGDAVSGDDYAAAATEFVIPTGETEGTIVLTINDDSVGEDDESIVAALGTPTGGSRLGRTYLSVIDIARNDTPRLRFGSSAVRYYEDAGVIPLHVYLTNPSSEEVSARLRFESGTATWNDFQVIDPVAYFAPGSTHAVVHVALEDDSFAESHLESAVVRVDESSETRPYSYWDNTTLEILDDDPTVQFVDRKTTLSEAGGQRLIAAKLSHPTNKQVSVPLLFSGSASKHDYARSSGSITIAPGEVGGSITIEALADSIDEEQENLAVDFGAVSSVASKGITRHHIYIQDTTTPEVEFSQSCTTIVFYEGYQQPHTIDLPIDLTLKAIEDVAASVSLSQSNVSGSIDTSDVAIDAGDTSSLLRFTANPQTAGTPGKAVVTLSDPTNADIGKQNTHTVFIEYAEPEFYETGTLVLTLEDSQINTHGCQVEEIGTLQESWSDSRDDDDSTGNAIITAVVIVLKTLHGYVDGGTAFFDANQNQVLDFLDLNQDGIQDPNEPSEVFATTQADGLAKLVIPEGFDRNQNGIIDPEEGQWVVAGGTDTATGLPLANPLVAPLGTFVVSPLSTLMASLVNEHGMDVDAAQQRVKSALELPDVDLSFFDPIEATVVGDAAGPIVFARAAQLQDTVTQVSAMIGNLADSPSTQVVSQKVTGDLARKILAPDSGLNLSNEFLIGSVIGGVLEETGLTLDASTISHASTIIAEGNSSIEQLEIRNEAAYIEEIARVQAVAEGEIAEGFAAVGRGDKHVSTLVAESTGEALKTLIDNASTGNVIPVGLSVSDAIVSEGDTGQTWLEFTVSLDRVPALPVSVAYSTNDGTATEASDYAAQQDTLVWNAGDVTERTVKIAINGDTAFEGDEELYLRLQDPVGAALLDNLGRGTIVDDDPFHYVSPADGQANELLLRLDGTATQLVRNGQVVIDATIAGGSPVTIVGAAGVQNELTVQFLESPAESTATIRFKGGSDQDAIKILGNAQSIEHSVQSPDSGEFRFERSNMQVAYSGVESVAEPLTPTIDGDLTAVSEGDLVPLTAMPADESVDYEFEWIVSKDDEPQGGGTGTEFFFAPLDDGLYTVTLVAQSDGKPVSRTSHRVAVENLPPAFELGGDTELLPASQGILSRAGVIITDPGADTFTASVNYGDATGTQDLAIDPTERTLDLHHQYQKSGTYPVSVTVSDDDGGSTTHSFNVVVHLGIIEFANATVSLDEDSGGAATISLKRDEAADFVSHVTINVTGGTAVQGDDFGDFPLAVTFDPGQTTKTVQLPIKADNLVERNETIDLALTAGAGATIGAIGTSIATVVNDDHAVVEIADAFVTESDSGQTSMVFAVSLSHPVDVGVTVDASSFDGTATTANLDYQSQTTTLEFPTASTLDPLTQFFSVTIHGDTLVEPDETLSVILDALSAQDRSVTIADGEAVGTIRNDDHLGGRVFLDRDNDGQFGADEADSGIPAVTLMLRNSATDQLIDTAVSDESGFYSFDVTPAAGTYYIEQMLEESARGLLDGKESAGVNGGSVDNSKDHNRIDAIEVGGSGQSHAAVDYLFAEIEPSDLYGMSWIDFNDDGEVNFGETGISGVTVRITGRDDRGNVVDRTVQTDADGVYTLIDLRPSDSQGYTLQADQPAGYVDAKDVVGEVDGLVTGDNDGGTPPLSLTNDQISAIVFPRPGLLGQNYNFAERPATDTPLGGGQTAGIGFWQNRQGQKLLLELNGGRDSTQLSDWLAQTFPNMYGTAAGDNDLTGMTNVEVADFYSGLFRRNKHSAAGGGPPKMDAQVMASVLATYVTNRTLAGQTAEDFGFTVTEHGVGVTSFNVGQHGAAFGVANDSEVQVLSLLLAVNQRAKNGVLYDLDGDGDADDDLETLLRTLANEVFSDINTAGD